MEPISLALLLGSTALSGYLGSREANNTADRNRAREEQNYQNREAERALALQFANQGLGATLNARSEAIAKAMGLGDQYRGDILGLGASSRADALQSRADMLRYAMGGLDEARAAKEDAYKGITTGRGSSIYFDPQRGWMTRLGPADKSELVARARERGTADQLLNEFNLTRRGDASTLEGDLASAANRGLGEAYGNQLSTGLRAAIRSSNPKLAAAMIAETSKRLGEAQSNARVDARIKAPDIVNQRFNTQRGALSDLYRAFSGAAAGDVGPSNLIPLAAQNASNANNNIQAAFGNLGNAASGQGVANANQMLFGGLGGANSTSAGMISSAMNPNTVANAYNPLIAAAGSKGGEYRMEQPNMATANAIASMGQAGFQAYNLYNQNQRFDTLLASMQQKYAPRSNTGST